MITTSNSEFVKCADCKGFGYRDLFIGSHYSQWERIKCETCKGAGVILITVKLGPI